MCSEKEHSLADTGFNTGFTHNVSTNFFACYIPVKNDNKKFNADLEVKRINELFDKFELTDECWNKFNYKNEAGHAWSDFDYELSSPPKGVNFFILFVYLSPENV